MKSLIINTDNFRENVYTYLNNKVIVNNPSKASDVADVILAMLALNIKTQNSI